MAVIAAIATLGVAVLTMIGTWLAKHSNTKEHGEVIAAVRELAAEVRDVKTDVHDVKVDVRDLKVDVRELQQARDPLLRTRTGD